MNVALQLLFASLFASLIYTPSSKYFWHTPAWCPGSVESAHTPGSSDYKSDTRRMVPAEMGSMYASLDGVDCRLAYSRTDTTNVTRQTHEVVTRRLYVPEEYETYTDYIIGGLEATFDHYPWSSSAFDYNFRGYPTYCDSYWGKMSDFSWHRQPLDAKIGLSSMPTLNSMAYDNPCGVLPYENAVFGKKYQIQTGVRDVFASINYGETTDGGIIDTVPEFLNDLRTNSCDHACGEDLSYDEVMWTTFAKDPRNIYSNSNRKVAKHVGAYNQALSLIDRTYCPYYENEPISCCGYDSILYSKRFDGVSSNAVYYIFDGNGDFIRDQCIPKDGNRIGSFEDLEVGETTNTEFVVYGHESPRIRASESRITGDVGCTSTNPVVSVYMADLGHILDLWFTNGVGYLNVDGGPVDDSRRGFDCYAVAFDVYDATNTLHHHNQTHLVDKSMFANKSGTADGTGRASASYHAHLSVSTNYCEIQKYPSVIGADSFVSSKRAHVFSSFLSSDSSCPDMTNRIVFTDEDDCNWRYRLKSYGYTTPSSLASDLDTDNGELTVKILSELKSVTGSDSIYEPGEYMPFYEEDALDKIYSYTNFSFDVRWDDCHKHNVKMIRNEYGNWEPEDTNTVFSIPCHVVLTAYSADDDDERWIIRNKGAVDTKRATVGEVSWSFPIKRQQDGVSGGSANFCSPTIGEGQYEDAFRNDGTIFFVDGDEPVYHVSKSGFEGAFGYNYNLKTVRFSYLTNVMERGFAEAFEHCTALDTVMLPSLEEVGREGFASAFDGCTSLTNVLFPSLRTAGPYAFYHTFDGCTNLTSREISFPALEQAGSYAMSYAFPTSAGVTNISFPMLKESPSGFLDGVMGARTSTGPQVCLDRFDMRSATNVDVRGIEVGVITNRFIAEFDRLEMFQNTTAYCLWPKSMRNVLDIRLDESPVPFDGDGMFWSGTPEKLAWDSTVIVPQSSTNAWRNSAWTNLCDNIFGVEDKWMLTDYPDNANGGLLKFKCRCGEDGISLDRIGYDGGTYPLVASKQLRDSEWELSYTNVWSRCVFRPYYDSDTERVYGAWFEAAPGTLRIDEVWTFTTTIPSSTAGLILMIYGGFGNIPIANADVYIKTNNVTVYQPRVRSVLVDEDEFAIGVNATFKTVAKGNNINVQCIGESDTFSYSGTVPYIADIGISSVNCIDEGVTADNKRIYGVTGSGYLRYRLNAADIKSVNMIFIHIAGHPEGGYDVVTTNVADIVQSGTNISWSIHGVINKGSDRFFPDELRLTTVIGTDFDQGLTSTLTTTKERD